MKNRRERALRGSLAAAFATFVALTSHVIAGGSLPTMMGLIVPLALSVLVCVLLAGRQLSLWRLSVSVGISQALFHLLFMVFTPMSTPMGAPTASSAAANNALAHHGLHHAGHSGSMGQMTSPAQMASMDSMTGAGTAMHAHTSAPMLMAHIVAAIITIAMIYWSESLPSALAEFARLIIRALVPALAVARSIPDGPRSQPTITEVVPRALGVLRSPVLRRGLPQAAF